MDMNRYKEATKKRGKKNDIKEKKKRRKKERMNNKNKGREAICRVCAGWSNHPLILSFGLKNAGPELS
jgi:hypothetical protein